MDMINQLSTKKEILIKQVFSNFKVSEENHNLVQVHEKRLKTLEDALKNGVLNVS